MTALVPPPRRRAHGALRVLSTGLIVAGVLLLVDAGLTVFWQEPVSALYNRLQQESLAGRLDDLKGAEPTPLERRALQALPDDDARLAFQARALNRKARAGQPIARLRIPRIDLDSIVVEGTGTDDLRKGPGHFPSSPMPGAPGTTAIAGHRTTYGAPFRHVDRLERGDRIEVAVPYGRFVYEVERLRIVKPTDTWVLKRVKYDRLVLTACHPLYSAAKRIIVFARLRSKTPGDSLI